MTYRWKLKEEMIDKQAYMRVMTRYLTKRAYVPTEQNGIAYDPWLRSTNTTTQQMKAPISTGGLAPATKPVNSSAFNPLDENKLSQEPDERRKQYGGGWVKQTPNAPNTPAAPQNRRPGDNTVTPTRSWWRSIWEGIKRWAMKPFTSQTPDVNSPKHPYQILPGR